jgi:hypothetical protein
MNGAVLHIMHIILKDSNIPERRFYLELCMRWMSELYPRNAAIGKTAQAYMTIAIASGSLTSAEAVGYIDALQQRGRHFDLGEVVASCIVDFDRALTSRNHGRAQELATRFEELAFLDI